MSKTRVYFPGLNGLRFFAAVAVIFTHIELIKKFLGYGSHWLDLEKLSYSTPLEAVFRREISWVTPFISNSGPLGVVFFFVLSGFLITYLLFVEKETTGVIRIKEFYMRRILRIWPLYFLIFILGFFVLPNISLFDVRVQSRALELHYWENFFLFLFFLPNLAFSMFLAVPNIGQLWSIGVEEQFYLIWPWVMKKSKNILRTILVFTGVIIVFKLGVLLFSSQISGFWMGVLKKFFAMSKLECMSLGGLGAYVLYYKKDRILKVVYHPLVFILSILIIPIMIMIVPKFLQNGVHILYSICSLVIILNVSTNPNCFVKLENKFLDFLGKISFGIYMYHMMIIAAVLHFAKNTLHFNNDLNPMESIVVYLAVLSLTILVSALSYKYLELPFIRRKKAVSHVISGENAK
jgi:peptidoglycan/LPS O-acetylase OafA/YrhL